jgi:hypothetical protein
LFQRTSFKRVLAYPHWDALISNHEILKRKACHFHLFTLISDLFLLYLVAHLLLIHDHILLIRLLMVACRQSRTDLIGLLKLFYLDFVEYVLCGQPHVILILQKILNLLLSVLKLRNHILASLVKYNCSVKYFLIYEIIKRRNLILSLILNLIYG